MSTTSLFEYETAALRRLLDVANSDTGQSRRVASFLLAWWNAGTCGGFDLTDLWAVDDSLALDMRTMIEVIARTRAYPDALGYDEQFRAVVANWRPHLVV